VQVLASGSNAICAKPLATLAVMNPYRLRDERFPCIAGVQNQTDTNLSPAYAPTDFMRWGMSGEMALGRLMPLIPHRRLWNQSAR
jgi:hypothetical protein